MKETIWILVLLSMTAICNAQPSMIPSDYQLVYEEDFEDVQVMDEFEFTDSKAWQIDKSDGSNALELYGASEYRARVRSPFNIALLKMPIVGDFVMEVKLAQSGREYGHRDLCLFFGVKDPTNYYYVHIASVADDNANNIFIVNDEPRRNIASKTTAGTDWGATNSWHIARIERKVADGTIRVYFDDMSTPIMEATDTHFDIGRVGFGSFDDTGRFDDIKIWAPQISTPSADFFNR